MARHAVLTVALLLPVLAGCAEHADPDVTFVAMQPAPWTLRGTAVAVLSPGQGQVVSAPVQLEFIVQNLAAGGAHLHVVVDDEPYRDVTDLARPVSLGDLAPGPHTVRIFPADSAHESIKAAGAFEAVQFHVGAAEGDLPLAPGQPLLTWNLPGPRVRGDSVPVDFFVRNATLAPNGHRVRVTVNGGASELIRAWVPYRIVGLAPGEHTVRLELLDAANRRLAGPYNDVERRIVVE